MKGEEYMINLANFVIYLIFYFFFIVVCYQFFGERNLRRFIGLIAMAVVVVLYTIGTIFFPRSPFVPTFIPPGGLLGCIYYLTYPKRRNHVLVVLCIIFIFVLIGAYINAVIRP